MEMTEENKALLLKDLCARLHYGVKVKDLSTQADTIIEVLGIKEHFVLVDEYSRFGNAYDSISVEYVKPYLRPMSSVTEEENKTIDNISNNGKGFEEYEDGWIRYDSIHTKWGVWPDGCAKLLDYLNSIHIDYRGLIPMGLALEAPEDMYK